MTEQPVGDTWPEQNAIDAWLKKHHIEVSFEQSMELKKAVSAYRIEIQKRASLPPSASVQEAAKKAVKNAPVRTIYDISELEKRITNAFRDFVPGSEIEMLRQEIERDIHDYTRAPQARATSERYLERVNALLRRK